MVEIKMNKKPVSFGDMVDEKVYMYSKHGYINFYKKNNNELKLLNYSNKEDRYVWDGTLVDLNVVRFVEITFDEALGCLLSGKRFR